MVALQRSVCFLCCLCEGPSPGAPAHAAAASGLKDALQGSCYPRQQRREEYKDSAAASGARGPPSARKPPTECCMQNASRAFGAARRKLPTNPWSSAEIPDAAAKPMRWSTREGVGAARKSAVLVSVESEIVLLLLLLGRQQQSEMPYHR
ncbi:hypothetical protein cyc_03312 [Cyclospora cayetanensis]|uniref:Uncharacterized protein n=1 Tax=Cyclospora cayetanensis TaxID=88456 RepID=A0A1D3D4V5_9EIME|nr:hypothetical protein cyc_03312 [Cyclospora cayetanensis]